MQKISFRDDILPLKDKLFRIALRITFNPAEAEDVVQDTMLRVWSRKNEWAEFQSIEAFCTTVARNLAIDRSQKKEAQNISLNTAFDISEASSGPSEILETKERFELIDRLINELPEKQRMIIQLRDIEGESYKEIARIMDISEEQVKVNLFRARQKVRQRYTEIEKYGL